MRYVEINRYRYPDQPHGTSQILNDKHLKRGETNLNQTQALPYTGHQDRPHQILYPAIEKKRYQKCEPMIFYVQGYQHLQAYRKPGTTLDRRIQIRSRDKLLLEVSLLS